VPAGHSGFPFAVTSRHDLTAIAADDPALINTTTSTTRIASSITTASRGNLPRRPSPVQAPASGVAMARSVRPQRDAAQVPVPNVSPKVSIQKLSVHSRPDTLICPLKILPLGMVNERRLSPRMSRQNSEETPCASLTNLLSLPKQ
jgi:hypothetical protein